MRKTKDAIDVETGEKIYFRSHATQTFMSDGRTVEQAIKSGGGSGGGSYDDTEIQNKLTELSAKNERLKERIEEQDQFIEDLQNTKIEKENDDYYPKMAVGTADNLAGVDEVDSEFNFRRSGGGAITDGVARVQSIKGNSVVWNQAMPKGTSTTMNGVTFAVNSDGSITANGTASETAYIVIKPNYYTSAAHKYAIMGAPSGGSYNSYYFGNGNEMNDFGSGSIAKGADTKTSFACRVKGGTNVANIVFRPLLIDLTKMFGAGNEPTTIEEFYQRMPMGVDMNAYNEGEVINMSANGIKSVGFNAWDEEIEMGALFSDGSIDPVNTRITTSFIPVIPNTTYYQFSPNSAYNGRIVVYDENKVAIYADLTNGVTLASKTFTTPSNAKYMRITFGTAYGTTYNHDICINISNADINGKYFPYEEATEDLSIVAKYFPNGMRSAGSAHDEIRYNKQSNRWDATTRLKAMRVKDGAWVRGVINPTEGTHAFILEINDISSALSIDKYTNGVMVARYPIDSTGGTSTMANLTIRRYRKNVYVRDDAYTDVASFLASFNDNDILYYELAEPIITEIEEKDFNLDYKVWNCGTETAIAEGKTSALAADITYGFNAVGLLKQIKAALQAAGLM